MSILQIFLSINVFIKIAKQILLQFYKSRNYYGSVTTKYEQAMRKNFRMLTGIVIQDL